ncbi:MAG: DUF488 family protein [Gemmatimonadetes bacterium]|nr:DUF488 family protein [Gemmatimonadota bacterium]
MSTSAPRFRIKRAYEPPDPGDGVRVLVDRLWPRGLSRAGADLDHWMKDVAPSPSLRIWFGHDPARFADFAARYRDELAHSPDALAPLLALAREGPVTLVYAARDERHNHALVLRDFLAKQRRRPRAARTK